jgi:hypothetical protein
METWPVGLATTPYTEAAVGFTVAADGTVYIPIHECPDVPGPVPVHYYSRTRNGVKVHTLTNISAMYYSPIVTSAAVYQMDELNAVHGYSLNGSSPWVTQLSGFSQGAMALDSSGNIYVGTDAETFGVHAAIYSLDASGKIRPGWPKETGGVTAQTTPVIGSAGGADVIYISNINGAVYAFNPDGSVRNGFPFSTNATVSSDPLAVGASGTVYLQTSQGLFAINPDGSNPWKFAPQGTAVGTPILDRDENIYVAFGNSVYSLDSAGNPRSGWPIAIPEARRMVLGGNGILYVVSQGEQIYSVTGGFLAFPLKKSENEFYTPEDIKIATVFDHYQTSSYTNDHLVAAFTGESAGPCGPNVCKDFATLAKKHAGYSSSGKQPFYVNDGFYTGGGPPLGPEPCQSGTCPQKGYQYLYYDGHPGFDYHAPCDAQAKTFTPVYAAVDGYVSYPSAYDGITGGGSQFHVLVITAKADPSYELYYLHMPNYPNDTGTTCMDQPAQFSQGDFVSAGQQIGVAGRKGLPGCNDLFSHLHFEVHHNDQPVDPYGWTGDYDDPYTLMENSRLWK